MKTTSLAPTATAVHPLYTHPPTHHSHAHSPTPTHTRTRFSVRSCTAFSSLQMATRSTAASAGNSSIGSTPGARSVRDGLLRVAAPTATAKAKPRLSATTCMLCCVVLRCAWMSDIRYCCVYRKGEGLFPGMGGFVGTCRVGTRWVSWVGILGGRARLLRLGSRVDLSQVLLRERQNETQRQGGRFATGGEKTGQQHS